jgi:hypothetical protein
MDYQEWVPLLGLPADDERVIARLAAHGWTAPVLFKPDELSVSVGFKGEGMGVAFESEYKIRSDGAADLPILSSVGMTLIPGKIQKNVTPYNGTLPYGLKKTFSKADVVALLGEPVNFSDDFHSARWMFEDGQRYLNIQFTEGWKNIKRLGIGIPSKTM